MKKDVEKFKELLKKLKYSSFAGINIKPTLELEQELIKMYEELEEPKEKPVIKVKGFYVECTGFKNLEIIHWNTGKGKVQKYFTFNSELKDGMLITDDLTFIKDGAHG